jgi:hypothetical protein
MVSTWPDPPPDLGEAAYKVRDQMVNQVKRTALMRMANDDPEAAADRLSLLEDSDMNGTGESTMLINSLMNAGKKEEARKIINQTMQKFDPNPANYNDFRNYQNYLQNVIRYMDDTDARDAVNQLVRTIRQAPPAPAGYTGADYTLDPAYILEKGEKTVEVTGAEYAYINMLRNLQSQPQLLMELLNAYTELKSKLDQFGGIDNYMSYGMNAADRVRTKPVQNQKSPGINDEFQVVFSSDNGMSSQNIQDKLYRELRKKAASDPASVKAKLRKEAKGKESINPDYS